MTLKTSINTRQIIILKTYFFVNWFTPSEKATVMFMTGINVKQARVL